MNGVALAMTPRNERILDLCGDHDSATIAATIYREMGLYLTANAVNCVIDRAKKAEDPRALARKSRRGRRSSSPWNSKRPAARRSHTKRLTEERNAVAGDLWPADKPLPSTSLLFINAMMSNCRFPLRGSGLGLIVCGAVVAEKSSYCPACRARTILRDEGGRTPAAADIRTSETLRSYVPPDAPRAPARVEKPVPVARPRRILAKASKQPRVGIDGLDLALQPPLPIRQPRRQRVLVPKPPQRTFFDRGQCDLFQPGVCAGYVDRGFSDWGGRAWMTANACRQGTSSPV
ncbi:hypothetical protein Mpop_2711 [Methylorubrum populi BJ001]|uniref:Uncharacterized protein n=1 Tax=Methylorubrum populi (strain ATCC BAA-705 / NCIMB 13946 / BJ001) TaxID=441620 RepID=B1ZCZ7_METPB|nr:hypothetical protein [Methylorubrum populi]ACB80866.1 hypothetical protein Mpop_2711 [Methylorubrum populi BJ001]